MNAAQHFQTIWDEHLVDEQRDGTCLLYIDRPLIHEVTVHRIMHEFAHRGPSFCARFWPDERLRIACAPWSCRAPASSKNRQNRRVLTASSSMRASNGAKP